MESKRKEVPDFGAGAVRGLYELIQPSGKRSWALRYRNLAGKSAKYTIGPSPEMTRKEARIRAQRAIVKRADGIDPAAEKRAAREAARKPKNDLDLVEAVASQFLKRHCATLRPATQIEAARYMKRITAAWAGRSLSSITRPMICAVTDSIIQGSPVAANRFLTWFSGLCRWAISRGIITSNSCVGIARPTAETARTRILTDQELRAVYEASDSLDVPYGAFVKTLIFSGQRRNECRISLGASLISISEFGRFPRPGPRTA